MTPQARHTASTDRNFASVAEGRLASRKVTPPGGTRTSSRRLVTCCATVDCLSRWRSRGGGSVVAGPALATASGGICHRLQPCRRGPPCAARKSPRLWSPDHDPPYALSPRLSDPKPAARAMTSRTGAERGIGDADGRSGSFRPEQGWDSVLLRSLYQLGHAALLVAAVAFFAVPRTMVRAAVPQGVWLIDGKAAVQIFECQGLLCGRILWLKIPRDPQVS
jgi:hypothetical protein